MDDGVGTTFLSIREKDTWTSSDIGTRTLATARVKFEDGMWMGRPIQMPRTLNWCIEDLKKKKRKRSNTTSENITELVNWWDSNKRWYMGTEHVRLESQGASRQKVKAVGVALETLVKSTNPEMDVKVCMAGQRYKILYKFFPPEDMLKTPYNHKKYGHRVKYNVAVVQHMMDTGLLSDFNGVWAAAKKKDDLAVAMLQVLVEKHLSIR